MMDRKGKVIAIIVSFVIIVIVAFSGYLIVRQITKLQNNKIQPEVVPGRLFYSNFQNKNDLKKFEVIDSKDATNKPSKWEISNKELIQKSNISSKDPINPGSFLIIKNSSDWQNIEADINFNPENNGIFGFLMRYQNDKNFYRITITCNQENGGPIIKIDKVQNGQISALYQVKKCFQIKSENNAKIIINSNRIDLYLNSSQVTMYGLDKTSPIDKGTFGFFVSSMPNIKINYLEIKKIMISDSDKTTDQVLSEKTEEEKLDEEIDNIMKEIGI